MLRYIASFKRAELQFCRIFNSKIASRSHENDAVSNSFTEPSFARISDDLKNYRLAFFLTEFA